MDNMMLLVIAGVFVLSVILIYQLVKKQFTHRIKSLETQLSSIDFVINELRESHHQQQQGADTHQEALKQWQLEHQQVSQQLEHRIKVLQEKFSSLEQQFTQLQQQQPQDRLYTRAQKMVALGADVDEIVTECGLPLAEAEILINMHKKK
ncbi:DUF2802 domain-containing protein [Thalassotalea sp. G2M2-11]|uniref:DUF2802 domain-containing protein n=1 Tax=Thalassotalea sp. G2M2-11 TaxID=2787627 RepID=UPI0024088933|nr:DUF2802 domain-containing protein [Thalassotalea sp. G2M2-11]